MNIFLLKTNTCYWIACPICEHNSYEKIYKIKKRVLDKPLAIMVDSFKWLEKNTDLNTEQIIFLKKYKKPFTVLTNSDPITHWLNYEDEEWYFGNREIYKKIAFRVAHTAEQLKLIKNVWPIFLTSANISNEPEIYDIAKLEDVFKYYLDKNLVKIIPPSQPSSLLEEGVKKNPSDIFEFIWESIEVKYLRKNDFTK